MIKHFIVMASSYSTGKRIALDYFEDDVLQMDMIQKDLDYILKECGKDVPISTHFLQTEKSGWDEVREHDKFFDDAQVVSSKEKFVELLLKDRILKGLDIAKYILTKVPCTHLKLEKLVYMCYADYLCETGQKLFNDKIYAYKFGPVIKSVYEKYKKSSGFIKVEDDTYMYSEKSKKMPIRSRILSSEDGVKKLVSIDKTLEKYKEFSATKLVSLTHQKSTPWSKTGFGLLLFKEISDELIINYHRYDEI